MVNRVPANQSQFRNVETVQNVLENGELRFSNKEENAIAFGRFSAEK